MTAALLATGCSPSGTGRAHDPLAPAIRLFIDGRYEEAAKRFDAITREAASEDDVVRAYLYLGRCYMELGDYVAAAEAFTSGRILGGGVQFDGLLAAAQQHLRITSQDWGDQAGVSRAELAALIDSKFGERLATTPARPVPPDLKAHWAGEPVERVSEAGVMGPLADGNFYPNVMVTWPSFYVTVLRLSRAVGVPETAVTARFPDGLRGVVATSANGGHGVLISVDEAADVLDTLEQSSR